MLAVEKYCIISLGMKKMLKCDISNIKNHKPYVGFHNAGVQPDMCCPCKILRVRCGTRSPSHMGARSLGGVVSSPQKNIWSLNGVFWRVF